MSRNRGFAILPPDTAKPAGASPGAPRFPQIWKRSANRFDDPDELVTPVAALASKADQLADPGAETVSDVTTCPGADTCRLGIASAKGLGSVLSAALEGELAHYRELARDVKIKISGCPNGCAQHASADIGFHSAAMTENGRTVPAYLLFVGGRLDLERSTLGSVMGKYPAKRGIEVLGALLELFRSERQDGEGFTACMTRLGEGRIKGALEPLRAVPAFEAEPLFYEDWGHENERFAVRQGVKGECAGATVAEKVPSTDDATAWLAQAEAYAAHREFAAAILAAYEAAAAAARVPLYRRLVDPFTSEQALWEFENIFVRSGEATGAGAWPGIAAELERLRGADPAEAAARAILERARALTRLCASLTSPEPA